MCRNIKLKQSINREAECSKPENYHKSLDTVEMAIEEKEDQPSDQDPMTVTNMSSMLYGADLESKKHENLLIEERNSADIDLLETNDDLQITTITAPDNPTTDSELVENGIANSGDEEAEMIVYTIKPQSQVSSGIQHISAQLSNLLFMSWLFHYLH